MRLSGLMRMFIFCLVFLNAACAVVAESPIETYEQCVAAGNKVLRMFPARCVALDGRIFVDTTPQPSATLPVAQANPLPICKDLCGNGTCEEMVCMGSGCPCAESHDRCPKDCPA